MQPENGKQCRIFLEILSILFEGLVFSAELRCMGDHIELFG
jgi:hypothetical protein